MQVDGNGGQVQFRPLHKDNEGKYTCRATNDVGHATASGQLTVLGQFPYFTPRRAVPQPLLGTHEVSK